MVPIYRWKGSGKSTNTFLHSRGKASERDLELNSPIRAPRIRELRNIWLCRPIDGALRPEFCDLVFVDGKIDGIRPADYRRFLRSEDSGRSPFTSEAGDPREQTAGSTASSTAGSDSGVIDGAGRVATAPFVNFHDHLYSRLAKGLALPGSMEDFRNILENLWWRLDQALDADMIEASVRLGSAESLRCGVSYLFDHHSSPGFVRGSLEAMGGILAEAGLRAVLCLETSDRHSKKVTEACFAEQREFIRRSANPDLKGLVGLHAPFTLSDQTLHRAADLCRELATGIHIHLAEDAYEQRYSRESFGCTAGVRLNRFGLLEHPGILAHGVHLVEEDWAALAGGQCALALNPESNLNNAVGLGRYGEIPDSLTLAAGTDGMHASPARSIKQLFLLHRHQGGEMSASFAFIRRLYFDQIRFVRKFFPDYPDLKPGDRADLVIWDYRPPSPFSPGTFWGHLVYGILESPAWTVFMEGKALLAEHRLLSMDVGTLERSAAVQGDRLFAKLGVKNHG
jgi:cytosine/adenosine deaminase-related metal-dependent hydrolase